MNRAEALAAAEQFVARLSEPPKNDRGYVRDGWKPPTVEERATTILRVADWLLLPEPPPPYGALVPPVKLLCDSCGQPLAEPPGRGCVGRQHHPD